MAIVMQTTHRALGDVIVLAPVGRIDYLVAADFERALLPLLDPDSGSQRGLVIDFSGVDYISSVGLRVLMIATRSLRGRGARIAVAALQPAVQEIFAVSRFDRVVEIFPTVRAALSAISATAAAAYNHDAQGRAP
jgi:anti-sigma B factor antagonist